MQKDEEQCSKRKGILEILARANIGILTRELCLILRRSGLTSIHDPKQRCKIVYTPSALLEAEAAANWAVRPGTLQAQLHERGSQISFLIHVHACKHT